jgi:hypothetical protein
MIRAIQARRYRVRRLLGSLTAALAVAAANAGVGLAVAGPENASCMGLGSSFYAHFATGERSRVAHNVADAAAAAEMPPGATYRTFAAEKEGGAIPAPCGTRIE